MGRLRRVMPRRARTGDKFPARTRAVDVAIAAGVSESAVSRTFRDGSVSAHARLRIIAAARTLGYRPNAMAQALLTHRSNVIAILMTTSTNSNYPEVLSELSRAAAAHGLRVMLFTIENFSVVSDAVDQILSYQVDAVLSLTEVPAEDARILASQGVELLLYNRSSADYPVDLVSCDHRAAGRVLGRYLVSLGHRHLAIIGGPPLSVLASERAAGVLDAIADAGIARGRVPIEIGDFGYGSGRAAARVLLNAKQRPTALACVSDMMAIGAIDEASGMGLTVPEAMSVAGFDGVPQGAWDRYRLTTMRQPLPQLALAAIETLKHKIAKTDRAFETRLLMCELSIGSSTTSIPPTLSE